MKKTLFVLLLGIVFVPSFAFAQVASSTTASVDVATLIAQLQAQIKELTLQLEAIQESGDVAVTTSTEFIAVRAFTQTLHRGMFGEEVKELQRFLTQHPEIYPEGIISGYFGALTEEAVKKFQEAQGLEPVGIVGPKTRAVINVVAPSSGGGISQTPQSSPVSPVATIPKATSTSPVTQAVVSAPSTTVSTSTNTTWTGSLSYSSGSSGGGSAPSVSTYYSEPTPSPAATSPATSTASTTIPTPVPTPTPSPAPANDTTGPTITSLSITPTSAVVGGVISFSATAEDPSGIRTVVYLIQYPGVSIVLGPNCNYNGVTSGTCAFGEPIDHARQNPSVLGDYTITIRAVDMLDNVTMYYPDGTVTNGSSATHNLTIPAITISAS